MASYNRVILLGNLTRDPQVRYIASGSAVTELGIAVNRSWTDKQSGQRREEVTFVDVTLWGRQAEIAGEYLSKGRAVLIEGRLQLDQWQDKETGQNRSKLRVVCENMTMVGGRNEGGGGGGNFGGGSGGGRSRDSFDQGDSGGYDSSQEPAESFYDNQDSGSGPSQGGDEDVPF